MRQRRRLVLVLRVALSAGMLGVLLSRLDLATLVPAEGIHWLPWLAAGLLVMLGAFVLATVRWQSTVRILDLPSRFTGLLSYGLAGLFVSSFLPSTVGGDVVRVVRLSASTGEPPASFASVVLERLTGFIVLPFITIVALLTHPTLLHLGTASRLALGLAGSTVAVLVVLVGLAATPTLGGRLAHNTSWLRFAGAVHVGLDRLRHRPRAAASLLLAALAYQLTMVLSAWLAAHALGIPIGWAPMMAFFPVVAIAQVLPLSIGGLGLREGALVLLLAPLGVTTGQAVALGLLLYGMNMAVSMLGAPAFAAGPRAVPAVTPGREILA